MKKWSKSDYNHVELLFFVWSDIWQFVKNSKLWPHGLSRLKIAFIIIFRVYSDNLFIFFMFNLNGNLFNIVFLVLQNECREVGKIAISSKDRGPWYCSQEEESCPPYCYHWWQEASKFLEKTDSQQHPWDWGSQHVQGWWHNHPLQQPKSTGFSSGEHFCHHWSCWTQT